MQIPPTPASIADLDLMKRLADYGEGRASWGPDGAHHPSAGERQACRTLHAHVLSLCEAFAYLMDKIGAREMSTFTMHDRTHARKVAHLMWIILAPDRRETLTPPEIAILVIAAHLHDLGMFLSPAERTKRLSADSDIWDQLELDDELRDRLRSATRDIQKQDPGAQQRAVAQAALAQEALLCIDTRRRHATRERYEALLGELQQHHQAAPGKVPTFREATHFLGDSFEDVLIELCVSHDEDAAALAALDAHHPTRLRFPREYPVGPCAVDLMLLAATLRLADILDFDRERTPYVLYHYFIPGPLNADYDLAALEWAKHLSISHWSISSEEIVFAGRCQHHVIHHAVVCFCHQIQSEIESTRTTLAHVGGPGYWPFVLPTTVRAAIHADGYTYAPYRFELDDTKIYQLLMGHFIYSHGLVAIRELLQNAVDACRLRDCQIAAQPQGVTPSTADRIRLTYDEPTAACPYPRLTVSDSGTGMDQYIIEEYLLKVGRSYYASKEFLQQRVVFRKNGVDFAPVSEFGIGFLSCFLLGDRVELETAMPDSPRADRDRRRLEIHGPTRLLRLEQAQNVGQSRQVGTRVTVWLSRGSDEKPEAPPSWDDVRAYCVATCLALPYPIHLQRRDGDVVLASEVLLATDTENLVPAHLQGVSEIVVVDDAEAGISGRIALLDYGRAQDIHGQHVRGNPVIVRQAVSERERMMHSGPRFFGHDRVARFSSLVRGGFKLGGVPGLPTTYLDGLQPALARIDLTAPPASRHSYASTDVARTRASNERAIGRAVLRSWVHWLVANRERLSPTFLYSLPSPMMWVGDLRSAIVSLDGADVYDAARRGWTVGLEKEGVDEADLARWERGTGPSLPAYHFGNMGRRESVVLELLKLVLHPVCVLRLEGAYGHVHYKPPQNAQWLESLPKTGCWPPVADEGWQWAEFGPPHEEYLLYHHYPRYVNLSYRQTLESIASGEEISMLVRAVCHYADTVLEGRGSMRQAVLSASERRVVEAADAALPGAKIAGITHRWSLADILGRS